MIAVVVSQIKPEFKKFGRHAHHLDSEVENVLLQPRARAKA
jgi:hypothetical protein